MILLRLLAFLMLCDLVGCGAALVRAPECPPFYECTGKAATNHPNCKCWDSK